MQQSPPTTADRDRTLPTRPPTLQTIADAMGVSRTTVSNAYNRPDQLTAELRARILAVADELGYAGPHPSARSLRTGRMGAVGVLLTGSLAYSLSDPTVVAFLRGMATASQDADLGLLLLPAPGAGADVSSIRNAMVDGFVVYSVSGDNPALRSVLDRRLPIVIVDEPDPGRDHAYIGIDDRHGAEMAARHLVDLGHRDFAIVVGAVPEEGESSTDPARWAGGHRVLTARLAGYRQVLTKTGIEWAACPIVEAGENTPGAARAAAAAILGRRPRPTAILATSDQLALGVLLEAAAQGLAVPGQLSVVGFDDVPRAAVSNPPLSTVRQPLFEKGRVAIRLLENAAGALRVELPIEFVARASSGPAPTG